MKFVVFIKWDIWDIQAIGPGRNFELSRISSLFFSRLTIRDESQSELKSQFTIWDGVLLNIKNNEKMTRASSLSLFYQLFFSLSPPSTCFILSSFSRFSWYLTFSFGMGPRLSNPEPLPSLLKAKQSWRCVKVENCWNYHIDCGWQKKNSKKIRICKDLKDPKNSDLGIKKCGFGCQKLKFL